MCFGFKKKFSRSQIEELIFIVDNVRIPHYSGIMTVYVEKIFKLGIYLGTQIFQTQSKKNLERGKIMF